MSAIDIEELQRKQSEPETYKLWLGLAVLSLFYGYQYVLRNLPGIVMDGVASKYGLSVEQIGHFCGIYYLAYTSMHIPMGVLLDRFSPRIIISSAILICSISIMPIVYSNSWPILFMGRVLLGLVSCAAILGAFKLVYSGFERNPSKYFGICCSVGLVLAVVGGLPLRVYIEAVGLRAAILTLFTIGVALAATAYVVIPKNGYSVPAPSSSAMLGLSRRRRGIASIAAVLCDFRVIALSVIAGLLVGPFEGFADAWGPKLFVLLYERSLLESSIVPALVFTGNCCGLLISGYLIARYRRCQYLMVSCYALVMLVCFLSICNGAWSHDISLRSVYIAYLLVFIVGCCSAYNIPIIDKIMTWVSPGNAALAGAILNMVTMVFGYVFHLMIAYRVASYHGSNLAVQAVKAEALVFGLYSIVGGLLLGLCLTLYLLYRERYGSGAKWSRGDIRADDARTINCKDLY